MESIEHLLGKIHNTDCLPFMRALPDKCVDLVLTDPPYGIGITNKVGGDNLGVAKDYGDCKWDFSIPDEEVFVEIYRISKNQIIWGGNYFAENLKNSSCWLVWNKLNSGNFADCELAYTSFKTAVRKIDWLWNGMLQGNMKEKEERFHPTQKPLLVFKWCVEDYSKPEQIIFDPFMGSGTTAVAAERLGRRWFGCELSEAYCAIAQARIDAERQQLKLFS